MQQTSEYPTRVEAAIWGQEGRWLLLSWLIPRPPPWPHPAFLNAFLCAESNKVLVDSKAMAKAPFTNGRVERLLYSEMSTQ